MDPMPVGYSPYAGYLSDDDERKRRMLAEGSVFGPGLNAPAAIAGAGAMGASALPGGLWGPSADYSGEAGAPRRTAPATFSGSDGGIFGIAPTAALPQPAAAAMMKAPAAAPVKTPVNPIEAMLPPRPPKFEGSDLLPGQITGEFLGAHPGYNPARPFAMSTDPMERIKQLFLDQQANAPNMGGDAARQLLGAQLGSFNEAMQGQTQRDLAREGNVAKVLEAETRYSPKALAGQTLLTLMGSLGGAGKLDPMSVKRALGVANEVQQGLAPNPLLGGMPGAAPGGGGNPSTPQLDSLSKIDQFLTANSALLPADYQAGGSVDVHGKPIPGMKGGVTKFGQEDAAKLMAAIGGAGLGKDETKGVMSQLLQTPAGADVRKAMLTQAALDELVNYDPVKNAPRQPGGLLSNVTEKMLPKSRQGASGQMPGVLGLAGTPFEYSPPTGGGGQSAFGNLGNAMFRHGIPYGQVKLPSGETLPIDPATAFTSPFNPLTPGRREVDQQRAARSAALANLYEALGVPIR